MALWWLWVALSPAGSERSLRPPAQEPPRCPRHDQTATDRPTMQSRDFSKGRGTILLLRGEKARLREDVAQINFQVNCFQKHLLANDSVLTDSNNFPFPIQPCFSSMPK